MYRRTASITALAVALAFAGIGSAHGQTSSPAPSSTARHASGAPAPVAGHAASPNPALPVLPDGSAVDAAQRAAMEAAAGRARSGGRAVVVDALMSPTQQVTAVPGGGFVLSTTPKPVRTRQRGAWVPVDLTLHRAGDGTLSPAATAYGTVSFSGGGRGALVTTKSGSVALSVSWPGVLPKPVVDGATATYKSVLPSVDLVVSATAAGGFTDTLVVKSAAAAKNPMVRSLRLSTHVTGGRLVRSADGALAVHDASGHDVMDAATPMMWDSNTAPASPSSSVSASASKAGGKAASATAAAAPDPSDAAHPGMAAHLAPVTTAVSDDALSLTPDTRMLTAPTTVYPAYVDPTFNWHPYDPTAPAFDEVKQGCPGTSFYGLTNAQGDYGRLGVGYNGWGGCVGQEHALYQWKLSSTIWDAHIHSATVNATEVYSAACSGTYTVNLHWSGGIGSGTDWNNRPGYNSYSTSAGYGRSYNPDHCPSNGSVSHGLSVLSPIVGDASSHASVFAVTLTEDSAESSKDSSGFSRFSDNPALEIFYNIAPSAPVASSMSAVSGADDAACATSAPYPYMGKSMLVTPPALTTAVSDPDGDKLQAAFTYWIDGTSTTHTGLSADNLASGTKAAYSLPASFVNALTTGQVVDWQATVTDGEDTTSQSSSPVCHFIAAPTAPDAPSVTSVNNVYPNTDSGGGTGAAAGTTGTFHFATSGGSAAVKFVYRMDVAPPAANPPGSEVVVANGNAADVTITPYSPGPHVLWVYAVDAAGNDSGTYGYPFLVAGDPNVPCESLAACFDNTGISSDSAQGAANLDGVGNSFSATDLAAAGWTSGGKVTVDGATFTLPAFGSGQSDNVLAANQTVAFSGSGNALEFLTTATYAKFTSPGAIAGDTTAPFVPAGSSVSGSFCYVGTEPAGFCPASGVITYTDGSSVSYDLTVPDWTASDTIAAVTLPHRNTGSGQAASPRQLYAFSVPVDPAKTIESVTLPDVGKQVGGQVQAMHIFAMATRDTTTGTPEADGTTAATPAGQTWTGVWASPVEGHYSPAGGGSWSNMTVRVAAKASLSGGTVRVKLDNGLGIGTSSALSVGHVTIAADSGSGAPSAVPSGTPTSLTFGGRQSVTIPAGGMVYSDPIPFGVTAGRYVLISYQLANSVPYLAEHTFADGAYEYVSAVGAGDKTTDTTGTPFTGSGTEQGWFTNLVSNLDVTGSNVPTRAVLGDGAVDPLLANTTAPATGRRVADILATAEPTAPSAYGTIGAGIEANQLTRDFAEGSGTTVTGGASALARLDRDILDQPGVSDVVLDEGLEDLLHGSTDTDLETNAYTPLVQQLQAWGIGTTLTSVSPCQGYAGGAGTDPCTATVDSHRTGLNTWLGGLNLGSPWSSPPVYYADFAAPVAVPDPSGGQKLAAGVDSGDHANLNDAGYGAEATTILSPHDTWPLDDGTGTTANDAASGTTEFAQNDPTVGANPLTLAGSASWTDDPVRGEALSFDGATGYAATGGPVLNTAAGYSVSAWVKLASLPSRNAAVVAQDGAQNSPFSLQYNYTAAGKPGWSLSMAQADTAGSASWNANFGQAAADTWTHLVGTYDATSHTAKLYVNGALAGTVTGVTSWGSANAFTVGRDKSAGANADFFPGLISDVQAWTYALAPAQIDALASAAGGSMSEITDVGDRNGDRVDDFVAVEQSTGNLYLYTSPGYSSSTRALIGWGWNSMRDLTAIGDANKDGYDDFLAIDTTDDHLYMYYGPNFTGGTRKDMGSGWGTYTDIAAVGDHNNDQLPDFVATDTSTGNLYLYTSPGYAGGSQRQQIGVGWTGYRDITDVGDHNGDGYDDIVVVNNADSHMYMYYGPTYSGTSRVSLGSGWTDFADIAAVGDHNGDQLPDFLATDTTTENLYLYTSPGYYGSQRKLVGTNW